MLRTRKAKAQPGVFIILYGQPGVGKTTLSTVAARGKTVSIASERSDIIYNRSGRDIEIVDAVDAEDTLVALEQLATRQHDYETVIVESLSAFDGQLVERTVGWWRRPDEMRSLHAVGGGFGKGAGEVEGYHRRAAAFLRRIANQGVRVIAIAHEDIETITTPNQESYECTVLSFAARKHGQIYAREADIIAHLSAPVMISKDRVDGEKIKVASGGDKITISFRPSATTLAKSRHPAIYGTIAWGDPAMNPFAPLDEGAEGAEPYGDPEPAKPAPLPPAIVERLGAVVDDEAAMAKARAWIEGQGYTEAQIQDAIDTARAQSRANKGE